jgi:hypothetical protein
MLSINSLQIVLPVSCAVLFALANHGCNFTRPGEDGGGIQIDAGGMGTEGEPDDAGATPDEDAGATPDEDAGATPDEDAGAGALACGTRGAASCAAGEFCNFEPDGDCGESDQGGQCEEIPQVCTRIFDPVCGCDDRSYGSACEAHGNGVSVKSGGLCGAAECSAAGGSLAFSDGASDPSCPEGEEQWPIGGGDEPALCCLGGSQGATCGGIAGLRCATTEFCNYELAAGGQGCDGSIADASGVCETLPEICTDEYTPVCGCDRRSYSNACSAHAAGVAVMREGSCTAIDCAALGGEAVEAIGSAPACPAGQGEFTWIRDGNGRIAIEVTACCVPL